MTWAVAAVVPAGAAGEQASDPGSLAAARLDIGGRHSCAASRAGNARCWGYGASGQLGYANTRTIGDDETPGSALAVVLGAGRTATSIATGEFHTCALIDDGTVRCWGFAGDGRLGYGNTNDVGDDEAPGAAGPVNLGVARTATAITAGDGYTCAILDDGTVRCWGYGANGRLGYGNTENVGDDETPATAGPVDLGPGRTAAAISAGSGHTCAVLDDGTVRCWGYNREGQLGYADLRIGEDVGDNETPGSVGPVALGPARSATAISAGGRHTCALLDDGTVRCWGYGGAGQLGYGNTSNVGQQPTITTDQAGPVNVGARTAKAITAGLNHTCALLDDGSVRCWGYGLDGRLGYSSTDSIGDDETPATEGPVDLGQRRTAAAISAGDRHTCALLDDDSIRCWGNGANGRLGYCNENNVGDDERPAAVGPVDLGFGNPGSGCAGAPGSSSPAVPPMGPQRPDASPAALGAAALLTAKLSLARARIVRRDRVLDVLAPITSLASGSARVQLHAAGLLYSFRARFGAEDARIRFRKLIPKAQAQRATGILTIAYRGDGDTRPQTVRLRAASRPADLRPTRPAISAGRLRAAGTISKRAHGVVRIQIEYLVADKAHTREFKTRITNGRWSLNERLSRTVRAAIAQRTGTVHSYTLFTGYYQARVRGEMRSHQILGPP